MEHKTRTGLIEYHIEGSPAFPDGYWGFEDFRLTAHKDGTRVLRAYCELHDEEPLIRDVIQSVDADFVPQNVQVRLTKGDKFHGSTWYHFTDSEAEYQGFTADDGRISEKVPYARNMRGFATHALNADAWLAARFDFTKGPGIQTWHNNLLTSADHRGATGPHFERTEISSLHYHGDEDVTVKAGTFTCHKFSFANMSNGHPAYEFWITNDGDYVYVKGTVAAPYNWSFELVEHKAS